MISTRPTVRRVLLLVALGAALGTSLIATGQDRGGARPEATGPRTERSGESEASNAETREVTEGQAKVKEFKFRAMDISGNLKSPQLLYFLNRLRAEFGRPRLPHRSFMPELQRSTKGKAF